jgi:F-type H+-transporting ATPase subunit b
MERLLQPDTGLMIWTVVTFLGLVLVLGKFAWKPLLQALNDREAGIKRAIEDAQSARATAEQLKAQFERELAQGQEKAQSILSQAAADAQKVRDRILKETEEEAQRLSAVNRLQLEEEKEKVLRDVRKEVARLSVMAAEKLIRHSVNPKTQEDLLKEFFDELDTGKTKGQLH